MTQAELSARAEVPLATLKIFEQQGVVALDSLLSIAVALNAVDGFLIPFSTH